MGIGLAVFLRIGLLFLLIFLIDYFQKPVFNIHLTDIISGEFNIHSLIMYLGGILIIYTSVKEIWLMISLAEFEKPEIGKSSSIGKIIFMIVVMNLVFSFDSILSAMALSNVLWIITVAIVLGGILMIWLSDRVSKFLQKNRMYEVLGLFILFLVGIMLLTEAGHLSELHLFGREITPMNKTTFYFIIVILVLIDVVQSIYRKKLMKIKEYKSQ